MSSNDMGTVLLPVLIVPGIMSSGLEVRKSSVSKRHIGQRVWLNPVALGFGAFYMGRALEKRDPPASATKKKKEEEEETVVETDSDSDEEGGEARHGPPPPGKMKESKYQEAMRCKSSWLQHLSLRQDMCTEREGIETRPIPGLDGVDFLTDLATIKVGASYVFGPIIKMMEKAGYTKGLNLDAATYDWRIPPSLLEERDGYFTETLDRIERMYGENGDTPVVLLCHSMGCKAGHYLLSFARAHRGQQWIDKHVHTYMPVGGPHIGASSTIGQACSASLNPMLDPMLTDEERLIFGRSLGSVPWLMPRNLPSNVAALPTILCRKEGLLEVSIASPIGDCDNLVRNKHGTRKIDPFKLFVKYGNKEVCSRVSKRQEHSEDEDAQYFNVSESFLFPTPPTMEEGLESLRFILREPGNMRASDKEKVNPFVQGLRYLDRGRLGRVVADGIGKGVKSYKSTFAMSTEHAICTKTLSSAEGHEIELRIPMIARLDMTLRSCEPKKVHRSIEMTVRVRWTPPPHEVSDDEASVPVAELPADPPFAPAPRVESETEAAAEYAPLSGQAFLRAEGLGDTLVRLTADRYENDPLGPRTLSSEEAPPVKRVYAVYGVNLNTCVASVCRRAPALVKKEGKVKARFVMDESARIVPESAKDPDAADASESYELADGIISETPDTPQRDLRTGETVRRSGDGTVPYWSLQQSHAWQSPTCNVRIEEIDGGEHRAILADKRFHKILLDYVGGKESIDLYEAEAAKTLQKLARKKCKRSLISQ